MFHYNKINFSGGIHINKSNKSKECMIYHYRCFLNLNWTYEPYFCNRCHDISMMAYDLENIAMLNVKGIGYRCVMWSMTRNEAVHMLNNSRLDDKSSLWIWFGANKRPIK